MKRKDVEALLRVYENINRTRSLTTEETEKVAVLAKKKKAADYNARYYAERSEKLAADKRQARIDNPDHERAINRKWDHANRKKRRVAKRRWEAANPDKVAAYRARDKRRLKAD